MLKAITKLIIVSAGLWLALPAAAQFEIYPDHFGDPVPTVVQPRPEHSNGSMRISQPYKQVQVHGIEASKAKGSPMDTPQRLPNAAAVQHHSVFRGSRVLPGATDGKATEQSRLFPSRRPYERAPQ